MRRRIMLVLCATVVCAVMPGCAASSAATSEEPAATNPNVITAADIAASKLGGNAYDLIRALRPTWGASRGATGARGTGSTRVSLDGNQPQALDVLESLAVSQIKEIRLLTASDATQRFGGATYGAKVILVVRN